MTKPHQLDDDVAGAPAGVNVMQQQGLWNSCFVTDTA